MVQNGDYYTITPSGISGMNTNYEDITINNVSAVLAVSEFNNAPEISGLESLSMLEGDSFSMDFELYDQEASDMSVELTDAPEYVSLSHSYGDDSGAISINPGFGDPSGEVIVSVTDTDYSYQTTVDTFYVAINHYPEWDAPTVYYVVEDEPDSLVISTLDSDDDSVTIEITSGPDYVSFDGQTLSINAAVGDPSGYAYFTYFDDGTPVASVSDSVHIIVNHVPIQWTK